jgi:hypothetical protein
LLSVLFTPKPQNFGGMQAFTDDIIEINGKAALPGTRQHSGFCFVNGQLAVPVCGQLKIPTSRVVSSVC